MVDPGRMRSRLTYEPLTPVPDGRGGRTNTYPPAGDYFARVEPVTGAQKVAGLVLRTDTTHLVTLRWQPGVAFLPAGRFDLGGRKLYILSIFDRDEKNWELKIQCCEKVGSPDG
jgi:head-tail adaptor